MKERKTRKRHDYSGSSFDSFLDEPEFERKPRPSPPNAFLPGN